MLKLIAIISMLIDHTASYLPYTFQGSLYTLMRTIGRLAFPIFAYEIAIGYKRSRNPLVYLFRMIGSAIITELVLSYMHRVTYVDHYPNIFITLSLGLALIMAIDALAKVRRDMVLLMRPATDSPYNRDIRPYSFWGLKTNFSGFTLPAPVIIFLSVLSIFIIIILTLHFQSDYYVYGVISPLIFHILNQFIPITKSSRLNKPFSNGIVLRNTLLVFFVFLIFNLSYYFVLSKLLHYGLGRIQLMSSFACILFPLEIYSKKPSKFMKYFYYIFYPLHLSILFIIASQTGNI